ncbi:MAG: hypothetical protein IPG02_17190 [Ignavibacteria bacterium]|nr:hypothetical protein [Ignavibacteria bacterium]
MKNLKKSTVLFIILNIIGMAAFISIAYSSWNSAEKLNSIIVESSLLGTEIEASKAKITELENKINEALTEGNKLKTMRMNKFSYFAPIS